MRSAFHCLDIHSGNPARKAIFEILSDASKIKSIGIVWELNTTFVNAQLYFQYEERPHSYGKVWESIQAPNWILFFSHFSGYFFFCMRRSNWRRRRGKEEIQIRFFSDWGEKMNHFWTKRKLWSMTFLSQSLFTLQLYHRIVEWLGWERILRLGNCTSLEEGIQGRQGKVLSSLVLHIKCIIVLFIKNWFLKSWVAVCT